MSNEVFPRTILFQRNPLLFMMKIYNFVLESCEKNDIFKRFSTSVNSTSLSVNILPNDNLVDISQVSKKLGENSAAKKYRADFFPSDWSWWCHSIKILTYTDIEIISPKFSLSICTDIQWSTYKLPNFCCFPREKNSLPNVPPRVNCFDIILYRHNRYAIFDTTEF